MSDFFIRSVLGQTAGQIEQLTAAQVRALIKQAAEAIATDEDVPSDIRLELLRLLQACVTRPEVVKKLAVKWLAALQGEVK